MIYPKLIIKLAKTNLENFNEVYSKLIDLYYDNKDVSIKDYINKVYGCLQNPNCMIYFKNIQLISKFLSKFLLDIYTEFKGHIVYIDTYEIYFRNFNEIKERFEKYFNNINKYNLTYFIEKSKFGYFVNNKKFLIELDNNIKIKGIKHFTKDNNKFINLNNN